MQILCVPCSLKFKEHWVTSRHLYLQKSFFSDLLTLSNVSKHYVKDSRTSSTEATVSTGTVKCSEGIQHIYVCLSLAQFLSEEVPLLKII